MLDKFNILAPHKSSIWKKVDKVKRSKHLGSKRPKNKKKNRAREKRARRSRKANR